MPVSSAWPILWIAGTLLLCAAAYLAYTILRRRYAARMLAGSWGCAPDREYASGEVERIGAQALFFAQDKPWSIDEITWNDLELEALYQRMNASHTMAGDAALYRMLREPARCPAELDTRAREIGWAMREQAQRDKVVQVLYEAGRVNHVDFPVFFASKSPKLCRMITGIVLDVALLTILMLSPLALDLIPGYLPLIAITVNLIVSSAMHAGGNSRNIYSLGYVLALSRAAQRICKCVPAGASPSIDRLHALRPALRKASDNGFLFMFYDFNPISQFFNHLLFQEVIAHARLMRRVSRDKQQLRAMLGIIGEIDACIAAASFRQSLPIWCRPEWEEPGSRALFIRDGVHPLLIDPMPNTLNATRDILITGSNASGKSTFLKAVAINALLAQAIATASARAYRAGFFHIATSMAVRDNLLGGESYFIVELRALKRLFDLSAEEGHEALPGLYVIDEVLRGTNTVERIAASAELLRTLSRMPCLCLAATHDIELTRILGDAFENLHFAETLTEDGMSFDYRLRDGVSTGRNAIALLGIMGFDPAIVQAAMARADEAAPLDRR